jgi:hypothetical protein
MSRSQNLYTGRSGQFAVMAEFLRRGYNVAIPEVDIGDDIFVVRDADGYLSRVQVKAAIGKGRKVVSGAFRVPMAQLRRTYDPELHYVFALHHNGLWREFLIIRRDELENLRNLDQIGNVADEQLLLYLSFSKTDVVCSGKSLQDYRGNWSNWPNIRH